MRTGISALAMAISLVSTSTALADDESIREVLRRLEQQEQRTEALEGELAARTASLPEVRVGPRGLAVRSSDRQHEIRLRGTLHMDGRYYADDLATPDQDTFLLRRVRPTVEGTFFDIYDFRIMPDFAGGKSIVVDAYVTARLQPWLNLTAGKQKPAVGLERLQGSSDIRFIERAFPTSLVPNRDLGVQLGGELPLAGLSYSLGYFNGTADGASSDAIGDVDTDADKDWTARLFSQPFASSDNDLLKGLGFGIAATWVESSGTPGNTLLSRYRTPGQQQFFAWRGGDSATFADGRRLRLAPQFHYYTGPFGLIGEYTSVSQDVTRNTGNGSFSDRLENKAWQLAASWFLTGEAAAFRGVAPKSSFAPGKPGTGAWELVARAHQLSIDRAAFDGGADSFADPSAAARKASAIGVGINWYLNQVVKVAANYERTTFDGGAPGGADLEDEKVLIARLALGF